MRFILALLATALSCLAVKQEDFKLCSQSSFCRRLRSIASHQDEPEFTSPYSLSAPTGTDGSWTWPIRTSLYPEIQFELRVDILKGDIARIRVDEVGSKTPWKRYNETAKWALLNPEPPLASAVLTSSSLTDEIAFGDLTLTVQRSPLKITQYRAGQPEIIFNDRSLFHMEHFRNPNVEIQEEKTEPSWFETDDSGAFEETFRQWRDSKPKGPEGLSIDITFPNVKHVYGLPEHASPLSLPDTVGDNAHYTEPYRLFNVDIFEYLADSPMSMYGAIPLLHAHSPTSSVGVLNLVGSETWVDVEHSSGVRTHWMSESGILDLLLLPGPKPQDLFAQYAYLTGPTPLPPHWATAYHQCRWNYVDEQDVLAVDRRFDEADIPLDVTWLDIEYADEHRYFDWDAKFFPDPVRMQNAVGAKGRKMVAIVDPHIKRTDSFRVYSEAKELDVLIRKADGSNFEGWCWTGSSVWVDFFNPESWSWWTRMFDFSVWKESTPFLFIWNDMNEPSVFDGPEISMPRDNLHAGGWEHRDVHNINGMMFHNQTQAALIARETPAKRPFVLSRSFFIGSHRYGAIWTGDNLGTWDHLAGEAAMLLSNNIAGMTFSGADVGGFFGNPTPELLVRWYQAGAFMPFFRAHAHIDTKRREPYLSEEPYRGYIRDIIRLRYQLLPVWYNAFHEASIDGTPIMRPQYAVFPEDEQGFAIDDQYYVGSSGLLVKPVVKEGAQETTLYISDDQPYYDYFTHKVYSGKANRQLTLSTPLSTFPLLIRGGSILPIRQRVRRSSQLMWQDPYTLIIALDKDGYAKGDLYTDDGEGYGYTSGEYVHAAFEFYGGLLKCTNIGGGEDNAWAQAIAHVKIERIVILGLKSVWKVSVGGEAVEFRKTSEELVIKNPGVGVVGGWEIIIE